MLYPEALLALQRIERMLRQRDLAQLAAARSRTPARERIATRAERLRIARLER